MAALDADAVGARAERMAAALRPAGWIAAVVDGSSAVGGGSAPGAALPTRLLAIAREGLTADALEAELRRLVPPVIARIERDTVVLDLRTVEPEDDDRVATLLISEFGIRNEE
jgi:L-seryl-tRNA(Ser) seleniumtransferase